MKSQIKYIFLTVFIGFLSIVFLNILSDKPNLNKNGFKRHFLNNVIQQLNFMHLEEDVYKICGASKNNLYLQCKSVNKLLVTDFNLSYKKYHFLNFLKNKTLESLFFTYIDSPNVYILASNVPSIISYNLNTNNWFSCKLSRPASKGIVISNNSFVIRNANFDRADHVFKKINLFTGQVQEEENISDKVGDGGFATDGILSYDIAQNRMFYTFFYCNRFLCLDSNLNLLYTGRTIDTCNSYRSKGSKISTEFSTIYSLSTPVRFVNKNSCLANGYIYINSALKADNESWKSFDNNSVIDIYKQNDGRYYGSFYIPYFNGNKMLSFRVFNDFLIAIYGKDVVTYRLKF
jgi:hypothetical protein